MGIILKIRQILGIEAAEQRAAEAAKQQKEMMTVIQATLAAITAAQNATKKEENVPATAQQEAVQAEKAALEAEISRLKAEGEELRTAVQKAQENAQKASVSAVKDYLAALRADLDTKKAEKKPVDGRNFCIRFDSAVAERLEFLQNLFRAQKQTWKMTTFVNEAVADALQQVFDDRPDLEMRLQQSLDEALQLAAAGDFNDEKTAAEAE